MAASNRQHATGRHAKKDKRTKERRGERKREGTKKNTEGAHKAFARKVCA
ncbi:MAG: hypothetical protein LBK92_03305 [Endomicrobium sp.]|nr:hypothetical protein [Endomicrobium sp.]